jgi:hypothetical protein
MFVAASEHLYWKISGTEIKFHDIKVVKCTDFNTYSLWVSRGIPVIWDIPKPHIDIEFSVFLNSYNIQYTNLLHCHLCGSIHYAYILKLESSDMELECSEQKTQRPSNRQHRRCLSARQPLNVGYMTLYQNIGLLLANHSEYWQHGAISYNKTQSQLRRTNEQAVVHKVSTADK